MIQVITRTKIYNGFFEIWGNERARALNNKNTVKLVYDDKYMILSNTELKRKIQFINQQDSKYNDNKREIWGVRWAPTNMEDTSLQIDPTARLRLSQMYKEILKKKARV